MVHVNEVQDLHKPDPVETPAVDGLSFNVEAGKVFAVLGANGARHDGGDIRGSSSCRHQCLLLGTAGASSRSRAATRIRS